MKTLTRFDCQFIFEPSRLAFKNNTLLSYENQLDDLQTYEGAHASFDAIDLNGEVAAVYLFQKGGKLFARGARYTTVLRDPDDVWQFLKRSKRVRVITLAYHE